MREFKTNVVLVLVIYLICLYFESSAIAKAQVNLSKHPVLIIVSFDGFRYDYLEKTETLHLSRLKEEGVSVPYMKNQFITKTFPNHHSIATGLHPESHGVVASSLFDPLYGKVLSGYHSEPEFWNYSSSVLPLWVINEQAGDGRVSGVMTWPGGEVAYGNEGIMPTYVKKYDSEFADESRFDEVISWITDRERPANLVFVHCDQPDLNGHLFGPERPETISQIQRMDNMTGYFLGKLKALNIEDKVNLIFLSDHGMEEVKPGMIIQHEDIVENKHNETYFQYGASPILQLLPVNENETEEIYRAFKDASTDFNFRAYLKSELDEVKPHWHYTASRRIQPILLVADPGYVFQDCENKDHVFGVHGYDNDYPAMHPFFIAKGPLFKSNRIEKPFENIDLFPLVCLIMEIDAPANNGSLGNVLPLLLEPDALIQEYMDENEIYQNKKNSNI